MFGISGSEFLVIILVAVVVVGPQRLPEYTRKLTQMVRQLRVFLDNARSQIAEEVGPEMADLDLSSLDPRQYDPRKIVRDALGEDIDAIREDLAHPFRTVGSAAKEISDDAAQAVNDVVKQDRANSLSKQIEAKRAEQSSEKDASDKGAEQVEPVEAPEGDTPSETQEAQESSAPPQGVLQGTNDAEPEQTEPADQAEPLESPEPAEPVDPVESSAPESVEVPTSLVEPGADPSMDAADEPGDDSHAAPVRPLSPRDIVRAANAAARTRAEAARVAVDF
ncbi:twin-arginine translocase TatA/TatE family subunit [Actinomyces naeslundii]|uniref:twin-arginine translocase TatA/TatE family subunit n=1 Tax=Actinomyces naeslundii TaxID=1655 RepID=UPI00096C7BF3|nr:twin-arginine translocase TatA/TatE family subunit [Actinomyces naeslundii]OMG20949.1 Sec-independent protein translocase TatB [Actinomyces naeslundii]OMG24968.1 Sec-independent protein translocase TatB [Actinomyces naeslundii]OMG35112.1 Sec-independent protein translocase TatB [Actinomyces naeslundii]